MEQKTKAEVTMGDVISGASRGKKTLGIILSILVILLGVFCLCKPLKAIVLTEWLFSLGFIIAGIFRIVQYVAAPKPYRNAMTLVAGILWIIIGALLIFASNLARAETIAFLIGFIAMADGITRLCSTGMVKKLGMSVGWNIFSGIISLLLSLFIFAAPLYVTGVLIYIAAAYLIVYGIIVLVDTCTVKVA